MQAPVEESLLISHVPTQDLLFCLLPQFIEVEYESVVDYCKVYLVNTTNATFEFEYEQSCKNKTDFELKNSIYGKQNLYLHNIFFSAFSESLRLWISWQEERKPFEKKTTKKAALEFQYKPKAKDIVTQVADLLIKNESAIFIPLIPKLTTQEEIVWDATILKTLNKNKKNGTTWSAPSSILNSGGLQAQYVIDIHIEKLMKDYKRFSNYEILQIQLNTVEKYVELALRERLHSMIIIHGIGTGKLRQEVHQLLSSLPFVKHFKNEHHPLYGFGATEVFF